MRLAKILAPAVALWCLGGTAEGQSFLRSFDFSSGSVYTQSGLSLADGDAVCVATAYSGSYMMRLDPRGNTRWSHAYFNSDTPGDELLQDVTLSADESLVACGASDRRPWIMKVDAMSGGTAVWERCIEMDGRLNSIAALANGDVICAGWYDSPRGDYDALVVRLNAEGQVLWRRALGKLHVDSSEIAHHIRPTADGGFILAGETVGPADDSDLLVMKLDGQGNPQWSKQIDTGGDEADESARIVETLGGYYVTASRTLTHDDTSHLWCLKLNTIGNVTWSYFYDWGREQSLDVQRTADGGCILTGRVRSADGASRTDIALVKLHANGLIDWQRTFGGGSADVGTRVSLRPGGGYLIAASSNSFLPGLMTPMMAAVDAAGHLPGTSPYEFAANFQIQYATTDNRFGPTDYQVLNASTITMQTTANPRIPVESVRAVSHGDRWTDLGHGVPGDAGIPELYGYGTLQPGQGMGLLLQNARPDAIHAVIAGAYAVDYPFHGDVLVPKPQAVVILPATDGDGVSTVHVPWPDGVNPVDLYVQVIVADPDAGGLALSNAVVGQAIQP